jgi:hypothetical protein
MYTVGEPVSDMRMVSAERAIGREKWNIRDYVPPVLNLAFSWKMSPDSGYRGCLVIPVVVSLRTWYYGIQYLVLRY